MAQYHYEWWTVDIRDEAGTCTWEFKGRNRETIVRQINKEVADTNSDKNAARSVWERKPRILEVNWNTLKLDRVGYQRLS